MAHFAQLDENNIVINVIVIDNNDILDKYQEENENKGIEYCQLLTGYNKWLQTSYNNNFRKRYACVGYSYDETLDMFIQPQPYKSWTLNKENGEWEAPIPMPDDGLIHRWDEESCKWLSIEIKK